MFRMRRDQDLGMNPESNRGRQKKKKLQIKKQARKQKKNQKSVIKDYKKVF